MHTFEEQIASVRREIALRKSVYPKWVKTGRMKAEFRNEKVLSAILEFKIREEQLETTVRQLQPVLAEVDTVVSWGLATRFAPDGTLPVRERLRALGVPARPNAKINLGLGRPLKEE